MKVLRGARWSSLIVGAVLVAGCGGASRNGRTDGAGGTQDVSRGGASGVAAGADGEVAGSSTTSGGVAGGTTGGSVAAVAGEPNTSEDGGQGGVAVANPLDWQLELEIIDPTKEQLEAGQAADLPVSTSLIAVNADGQRALAAVTYPGPVQKDGTLELTELIGWTKEQGSVSLGMLPGVEPGVNGDAPHQFSLSYWAGGWTKDLKTVVGSVDGATVAHAFIWHEGEGMTELELPGAPERATARLSEDGKVVVVVTTKEQHYRTFRFDVSGRTELSTLPGYDGVQATYVNADGSRIVGEVRKQVCQLDCVEPFSWQSGGELQAFPLPQGVKDCGAVSSQASGSQPIVLECTLASDSQVRVVWSDELGWQQIKAPVEDNYVRFLSQDGHAAVGDSYPSIVAWRWDSTKGPNALSPPADLKFHELTAFTDDASTTLVVLENAGSRRIPFKWTADGELVALPAPAGGEWPTARAMSADGTRILGAATGVGGRNVLWVDDRAYFLEQLFTRSGIDWSDYKWLYSTDLSRDGHTVSGYLDTDEPEGFTRGWFVRLP